MARQPSHISGGTGAAPGAWSMLAAGTLAQAAGSFLVHAPAFLIPALRHDGLALTQAGVLVAMPLVGMMLALVAWGALADRFGERVVLAVGLAATAVAAAGAALAPSYVVMGACLLLGGMAAASTNAASGRVVVGWFPAHRRGLAMGIRQVAQPLGVGAGALALPGLALGSGAQTALAVPAVAAAVVAVLCAVVVRDPPRPARSAAAAAVLASPYRRDATLVRIHAVSVLLVVPQFTLWTYALTWLIVERNWSPVSAGALVTVTQLLGAAGRVLAGVWSDRVGSRLRPLRSVACAAAVVMALLGLTDRIDGPVSVVVMVLATVVTVADNGLAFTSVAELAGPFWSGRALGAQNTAQFLAASAVPPVVGALLGLVGYPVTFALTALLPAVAAPLVPVHGERPAPVR